MAIKGTESKGIIFNKLQEIFPGSFWEDQGKILRIPLTEDGSRVEIKVSLTAAKTNLGGDEPESAFTTAPVTFQGNAPASAFTENNASTEPTQEEKENISRLIAALEL